MNPAYYQYQLGASAGFQQVPAGYTTTQYIGAPPMTVGRVQVSLQPPPPPPPVSFAQFPQQVSTESAQTPAQTSSSCGVGVSNSATNTSTNAVCVPTSPTSVSSTSQSSTAAAMIANETKTVYSQPGGMITAGSANVMQTGQFMMPQTQQQSSQFISGVYAGAYIQQAAVQPHATQLSYPPQAQQHVFAPAAHAAQYASAAPKVMYIPSAAAHPGAGGIAAAKHQQQQQQQQQQATSYFLPQASIQPGSTLVTDPNTGKTYLLSGASQLPPQQYQIQTMPGKQGLPGQQYLVAAPQQYHAFPAAAAAAGPANHAMHQHHYAYATGAGQALIAGRNPAGMATAAAGPGQVPVASYAPASAGGGAMPGVAAAPQVYPYM